MGTAEQAGEVKHLLYHEMTLSDENEVVLHDHMLADLVNINQLQSSVTQTESIRKHKGVEI